MSFNTFGHLFRVTTYGESHGPAIGCVVDGCPPRIPLTEADIQPYLDRRRPGQSRYTTQRQEPDAVKILSGVFVDETSGKQVTTGTSINAQKIIRTSKTNTGQGMPTTLMMSNTACAIIAAAAANRRERPRCVSPPAQSHARSYLA
jgi:chorismate synthase